MASIADVYVSVLPETGKIAARRPAPPKGRAASRPNRPESPKKSKRLKCRASPKFSLPFYPRDRQDRSRHPPRRSFNAVR